MTTHFANLVSVEIYPSEGENKIMHIVTRVKDRFVKYRYSSPQYIGWLTPNRSLKIQIDPMVPYTYCAYQGKGCLLWQAVTVTPLPIQSDNTNEEDIRKFEEFLAFEN